MAAFKLIFTLIPFAFLLGACTGSKEESVQLFYGPCKLRVVSTDKHDEILVDGIEVGEGSVDLKVPCGYRQVRITRHHHVEFVKYVELIKGEPQEVKGTPEPLAEAENYALSEELIERVASGKSAMPSKEETKSEAAPEAPKVQPEESKPEGQEDAPDAETKEASDDWS